MSQQLTLEGMPRRLFRATPTRLLTWLDCPRRYRFGYLDRPTPQKSPPWAHNSVGASVHNALAAWWRLPIELRTPAEAGMLLEQGWLTDGFAGPEQSRTWRQYARGLVERYVADLDPTDDPIGVERTVALRTEGLALSGRIDRLDERPVRRPDDDSDADADPSDPAPTGTGGRAGSTGETELVVVDYKTGRWRPSDRDARSSLALAVYAAAASRTLRRPCHRVELHHLPTDTVAVAEHTADGIARHLRRAEQIGQEAAAADEAYRDIDKGRPEALDEVFPPHPGPQCHWCDFAPSCPEGRQAFPPRRPWDGLGEPDVSDVSSAPGASAASVAVGDEQPEVD